MNASTTYWLCRAQGSPTEGPFTLAQLRAMYAAGTITVEALVCEHGAQAWSEARWMLDAQQPSGKHVPPRVVYVKEKKDKNANCGCWTALACVIVFVVALNYIGDGVLTEKPGIIVERSTADVVASALKQLEDSAWAAKTKKMLSGNVVSSYDKFKKRTTYEMKSAFSPSSDVMLEGHVVSAMDDAEPSIFMMFSRKAEDWQWLSYHTATMKLDEMTWTDNDRISTDTLGAGMVMEIKSVTFTLDQALALATAKEVAVQIGLTELDLSSEGRLAILGPLMQWLLDMNQKLKTQ